MVIQKKKWVITEKLTKYGGKHRPQVESVRKQSELKATIVGYHCAKNLFAILPGCCGMPSRSSLPRARDGCERCSSYEILLFCKYFHFESARKQSELKATTVGYHCAKNLFWFFPGCCGLPSRSSLPGAQFGRKRCSRYEIMLFCELFHFVLDVEKFKDEEKMRRGSKMKHSILNNQEAINVGSISKHNMSMI